MGNLLITMVGIVFCALLMVAGMTVLQPTAYIEHNEANTNSAQISTLMADYNNLLVVTGHRPTAADYAAIYPNGSVNAAYTNAGGTITVNSQMEAAATNGNGKAQTPDSWTYMPGCGVAGGPQDCFCLTVNNPSNVVYKATQVSAIQQMESTAQSRVEFNTDRCANAATATLNPSGWPTSNPGTYYLTVRLNAAASSNYTCNAVGVSYGSCPTVCGTSTEAPTSWSCDCSDGVTRGQSYCSPSGSGPSCSDYAGCTYSASAQYGACNAACGQTGTEPVISYTCTRSDGTVVSDSYCTAPSALPCNGAACASVTYTASNPVYQCSTTCGTGTNNLISYTCNGSNGSSVPVTLPATSNCTPPASTNGSCEGTSSCEWVPSYGTCDCTSLTEPITYTCTQSDGKTVVNSADCTSAQPSATSKACTPPAGQCPTGASFVVVSTIGCCLPACGASTQTITYSCTEGGVTVDSSVCTANGVTVPANTTQACTDNSECVTTGACGTSAGVCTTGTASPTSDNGTTTSWTCTGSNGTPQQCSVSDPVSGSCSTTTQGACTVGTASSVTYTGYGPNGALYDETVNWSCAGPNGGPTQQCTIHIPVCGLGSTGADCPNGQETNQNNTSTTTGSGCDAVTDNIRTWTCTVGSLSQNCFYEGYSEACQ